MNGLWQSGELIQAMEARPVGAMPSYISGISIDSRSLKPGEAFFAIHGAQFDGHDFVTHAMKAGAAAAIVSEDRLVALGGIRLPLLVVRDVLAALSRLGAAARRRTTAKIIAVTGSAGKTSTKDMLRAALGAVGTVHAAPASFNNHWGVPLTLARLPRDAAFGIFEIGMNHAGEIRPLSRLVRPHVAIITNVAPAHIGAFRNIEAIALAKSEIFDGVTEGGAALIPRDSRHFSLLRELAEKAGIANVRTFGTKRGADFRLLAAEIAGDEAVARAAILDREIEFRLQSPGRHMLVNALAALGAACIAGADITACAEALSAWKPEAGRGQRREIPLAGGSFTLFDESYNANPASMEAALQTLGNTVPGAGGRRIAVLGDMRELGEHAHRLHRALQRPLVENGVDLVFLAGEEMAALAEVLKPPLLAGHYGDGEELGQALEKSLRPGDVVMIKASNGMKFAALVDRLTADEKAGA